MRLGFVPPLRRVSTKQLQHTTTWIHEKMNIRNAGKRYDRIKPLQNRVSPENYALNPAG